MPGDAATRLIGFAGYDWAVKDSNVGRVGPGENYFTRASISTENGGLRLRARVVDGRIEFGEVVLVAGLSYGTDRLTVATDLSRLASSLTLGMFLWSDIEDSAHREIDIEVGRWGQPRNDEIQFVLQPYTDPGNMLRFALGTLVGPSVHSFNWLTGCASTSRRRTAASSSNALASTPACRR